MSYAMGFGQAEITPCDGGQYHIVGGKKLCCAQGTWSNYTTATVLGVETLQYHNEERVRQAAGLLLNPTVQNDRNGLEKFAYDAGLEPSTAVDPNLVAQINAAWLMYKNVAPQARWKKGSFPYNCAAPPMTDWVVYDVYGGGETSLDQEQLETIHAVPGGAMAANVRSEPRRDQLLTVVNGAVQPSAWTKRFIAAFAPGLGPLPLPKPGKTKPTTRYRLPPLVAEEPGAGGGARSAVVIAVGLIAVAGIGALLWRRR